MEKVVIIGGTAGQGIQVLGQLLAHAAVSEGKDVFYFSDRGGGQRTGPSECMVAIASGEINAPPLVRQPADALIAMDQRTFNLYQDCVKPGGILLVNTSVVNASLDRNDVEVLAMPASLLAYQETGNILMANMVATGAFLEESKLISLAAAEAALEEAIRPQRHHFNPENRKALAKGIEWARGEDGVQNRTANRLFPR